MALMQQYEPVTDARALTESLRHVAGRLRWMRWVRMASLGAFVGVCVSIVLAALAIVDLLPDWMMLEVAIPLAILVSAAVGSAFALRRPVSLMDAARVAEDRLGLKERLSSALEFESYRRNPRDLVPSLLIDLQQRDAMRYASAVRPNEALPFRWPWQLKALIAASVVLILTLIIPNLPIFVPPGVQLERAIVAREGNKLAATARLIEQLANAQQLPHTKWTAQQMRRLGVQMAHGHMDKRQAFVRYAKLTQQMQDLQRQMQSTGAGQGGKSLSTAGRQLADALRASTPSAQNPNGSQAGAQGRGTGSGPGNMPGKAGSKNSQQHGFTVPSFNNKSGGSGQNQAGAHPTSEIQQAAQAMQQGNAQGLSQQLRQLADRVQSGKMTPAQQQQAQQDLQKLSDALKGTPMPDTQRHSQAAADAMKQGDTQGAADEMRKAADAADREMKSAQDRSAMQDAQQALQRSQSEMAGAASPSDVGQSQSGQDEQGDASGNGGGGQGDSTGQDQPPGQGDQQNAMNEMKRQGEGSGQGNQGNSGGSGEEGGGSGAANRAGHNFGHGSSNGNNKWSKFQGPPGRLNPNFDPSKFPKYAKIYLGKPQAGNAAGHLGATLKSRPGPGAPPNAASSVPYYNYVGGARREAERAVDNEDIPPAYKQSIQKYFDSLTPQPQQ